MHHLTEEEYLATFSEPMVALSEADELPFDFWPYFHRIPAPDFAGHDCSAGQVDNAWRSLDGSCIHVLVNSENRNIFMVVVLDLRASAVLGHRLLDLEDQYGLK
jgi:hypothetical protein